MEDQTSEIKLHAMDYWQVLRNRYGIILLTFLLVLLVAGVITYILPRQYRGNVLMEVRKQAHDMTVFERDSVFADHSYLYTQFEIIKSRENLYRVISDLNLVERWGASNKSMAYAKLASRLTTNARRQTDLIQIEVFAQDPEEAAELANAIAQEYQKRRVQEEDEQASKARESLDVQLAKMSSKVEESRSRYMDLTEKYRIFDLSGGNSRWNDATQTGDEALLSRSRHTLLDTKQRIEQIRTTIAALQNLSIDDLIDRAASLNISDSHLRTKFEEYKTMELSRESGLLSGLGRKHSTIQRIDGQLGALRGQLEDEAHRYKQSLDHNLDLAEGELSRMTELKIEQEDLTIDNKRQMIDLEEAKQEYKLDHQMLGEMQSKLRTSAVDEMMSKTPAIIHEHAEPNSIPAKPRVGLNLLLGGVVGLLSGLTIAFFLEYMDTSVKSLEDVERYLNVPVLAVIPRDVGILHRQSGASPDAEAYRILRTNIEFNRQDPEANAISVVSGGAGEGKSTTLVNLAYICAQGGYTTLLIDADLRRPSLHNYFDINNTVGLTNYLTTDLMLEDVVLQTAVDNLYFLPSGILPADAAGILNSRRMSDLIADVKSRFDLVLVDSPPILGVSDASVIASEVDMTMIVIQHRKLPRNMLLRVKQAVDSVGGHVVGAVLNNVDVRSDNQYQYYTSYYTYYSPSNTGDQYAEEQAPSAYSAPAQADGQPSQASSSDGSLYAANDTDKKEDELY